MNARVLLSAVVAATLLVASSPSNALPVPSGSLWSRADFVEHLERLYLKIDTKARGYFTASDLVLPGYHIVYPPVPYPGANAQAPFRCVDTNRDGRISHEEYVEYGLRAYDATASGGYINPTAYTRAILSDGGCK